MEKNNPGKKGALPPGSTFVQQIFLEKVSKMSNRGWSLPARVLELDQDHLRYYKSVPKDFKSNSKCKY